MEKLLALALCIAAASASAVVPTYIKSVNIPKLTAPRDVEGSVSCGGAGQFLRLAVTDCTLVPCIFDPGAQYDMEIDFITSEASNDFRLVITLWYFGVEVPIVEVNFPDVGAGAGDALRVSYSIVPTSELSGSAFLLRGAVYGAVLEVCRDIECYMN